MFMVSGQWRPSYVMRQHSKEPGRRWSGRPEFQYAGWGSTGEFSGEGPMPLCSSCSTLGHVCMQRGRDFHCCFSTNGKSPLSSQFLCCQRRSLHRNHIRALLGPHTSFTQDFTHSLLCSTLHTSKWQYLMSTTINLKN